MGGRSQGLVLLTLVGTVVGRSDGSSSPRLQIRPMTSMPARVGCGHQSTHRRALEATSCPRGGATNEGDAPYRGYERDDGERRRPPPYSKPYDYDSRRDRPRRDEGRRPPPRDDRGGRFEDGPDRYGRRDYDEGRDRRWDGGDRRGRYDERDGRDRGAGDDRPAKADREDGGGGKKKWFSMKKDKGKPSERPESSAQGDVSFQQQPPPPPPPPPTDGMNINPAETERTPIHYMFPTAEAAAEERRGDTLEEGMTMKPDNISIERDAPDLPFLDVDQEEYAGREGSRERRRRRRDDDDDDERYRASPRRDAVTVHMATRRGALQVRLGSVIVGAALGGFLGKSLLNDPLTLSLALASLLFVTGFLRNDYGELSRALGLAFVFTLQRCRSVRKEYPTLPHVKAMIRQSQRRPFPPVEEGSSPWKYEPIYRDDPDFKMTYVLLAMALVGSFCGGNVPLIPQWIGGIAGALAFASFTMGANARGDLGRAMGMRIVALVQVVLIDINSELRILGKAATVGGLIFDKVMIMDRKHRIKDRIVAICKWGYDKVSRTAEQVKEDMQEDERPERRPERSGPERLGPERSERRR
ncbi:hypothetical protein ACHAXT_010025 [Thalassiosira profunda]